MRFNPHGKFLFGLQKRTFEEWAKSIGNSIQNHSNTSSRSWDHFFRGHFLESTSSMLGTPKRQPFGAFHTHLVLHTPCRDAWKVVISRCWSQNDSTFPVGPFSTTSSQFLFVVSPEICGKNLNAAVTSDVGNPLL